MIIIIIINQHYLKGKVLVGVNEYYSDNDNHNEKIRIKFEILQFY